MPITLADEPRDILCRYLSRKEFVKRCGIDHPDPMIEEFSYGEGGGFSHQFWKNIDAGSRLFLHTTIGGARYLTAMYNIYDFAPGAVWRVEESIRSKYKNPHLHPEDYPDWWPDYDPDDEHQKEIRQDYANDIIHYNEDIVMLGDPEKSYDIRSCPIVLNKEVLSVLDMFGKPMKWDIMDKNGVLFDESKCMNSCLRVPRFLTEEDGDYLENLIKQRISGDFIQPMGEAVKTENASRKIIKKSNRAEPVFVPLDSLNSSKILRLCKTEKDIEEYIIQNIGMISSELKYESNQVRFSDGNRIDILARNAENDPVIIEVKKGTARDETLAQLLSYIFQYRLEHPGSNPVGKIVCEDASYRLKAACNSIDVHIYYYGDSITAP